MRRIVCIFLILLISYSCLSIVRVIDENNSIYHQINQQELLYEKKRSELAEKIESIKGTNKEKVEELERYRKWNTEIVDYIQ